MQLVDEAPEDEEMGSGLEVTSAFTANVWEVCVYCTPVLSHCILLLTPQKATRSVLTGTCTFLHKGHSMQDLSLSVSTIIAWLFGTPFPCAVQVQCKVGDQVKKGQVLVVLEAMKMEYPIAAPADGKVHTQAS